METREGMKLLGVNFIPAKELGYKDPDEQRITKIFDDNGCEFCGSGSDFTSRDLEFWVPLDKLDTVRNLIRNGNFIRLTFHDEKLVFENPEHQMMLDVIDDSWIEYSTPPAINFNGKLGMYVSLNEIYAIGNHLLGHSATMKDVEGKPMYCNVVSSLLSTEYDIEHGVLYWTEIDVKTVIMDNE